MALRTLDAATTEIRERNAQRVAEMKERMGRKYVLHPDNAPKKSKYRKVLKAV
jgi:hypothetical protein